MRRSLLLILILSVTAVVYAPPASEQKTIEGELTLLAVDYEDRAEIQYWIMKDKAHGKGWRLEFPGPPPKALHSGVKVKVRGRSRGAIRSGARRPAEVIDVDSVEIMNGSPAENNARMMHRDKVEGLRDGLAADAGPAHALIVLIADFNDSVVPCSDSEIAGFVWTDALNGTDMLSDASYGDETWPQDSDPNTPSPDLERVTLSTVSKDDSCSGIEFVDWGNLADAEATQDIANYGHVYYVFPSDTQCSFIALGELGPTCPGDDCEVYHVQCTTFGTYAHELGHNLGWFHAGEDLDDDGTRENNTGDRSDTMAIGGTVERRLWHAQHRAQLGWIPTGGQIVDHPINTDTTYTLSAVNIDPDTAPNPQIIRVFRPSLGEYYYISYRDDTNYDSTMQVRFIDKISIHRGIATILPNQTTALVDVLDDLDVFTQAEIDLTVTMNSHTADTASVTIELGEGSIPNIVGATSMDGAEVN